MRTVSAVAFVAFVLVALLGRSSEASSGQPEPARLSCRGPGAACDDQKDSTHWCCSTPRTLQCVHHRCQ